MSTILLYLFSHLLFPSCWLSLCLYFIQTDVQAHFQKWFSAITRDRWFADIHHVTFFEVCLNMEWVTLSCSLFVFRCLMLSSNDILLLKVCLLLVSWTFPLYCFVGQKTYVIITFLCWSTVVVCVYLWMWHQIVYDVVITYIWTDSRTRGRPVSCRARQISDCSSTNFASVHTTESGWLTTSRRVYLYSFSFFHVYEYIRMDSRMRGQPVP